MINSISKKYLLLIFAISPETARFAVKDVMGGSSTTQNLVDGVMVPGALAAK